MPGSSKLKIAENGQSVNLTSMWKGTILIGKKNKKQQKPRIPKYVFKRYHMQCIYMFLRKWYK